MIRINIIAHLHKHKMWPAAENAYYTMHTTPTTITWTNHSVISLAQHIAYNLVCKLKKAIHFDLANICTFCRMISPAIPMKMWTPNGTETAEWKLKAQTPGWVMLDTQIQPFAVKLHTIWLTKQQLCMIHSLRCNIHTQVKQVLSDWSWRLHQ